MCPNKNANRGLENHFQPDQTKGDVVRCLIHQLRASGISYIDDSDDDDFGKQTDIENVRSLSFYSGHFEALLRQPDKTYSAFILQCNPSNCASKRSYNDEEWSSLDNYFLQICRTEGPSILHSLSNESSAKGVPVLDERPLQENQAILFPSGASLAVKKVKNDETNGFSRRLQTPHDTTATLMVHQTSPIAIHTPRTVLGLRQGSDLAAIQLNLNHQTNDWPSSDTKVVKHSKQEEPTLLSQDKQCITLAIPSTGQCFPTIEMVHTISLRCVPCNCSMGGVVSPIMSRPCLCGNPSLPTNKQQLPPESLNLQTGEQIVLPVVSNPLPSNYTVNPIQSPVISERESSLAGLVALREQDTSQLQEQRSTRACCYGSPVAKSSIKKTGTVAFTSGQSSDQQIFSQNYRRTPSPTSSRQNYDCCRSQKIQHSQDKLEKLSEHTPSTAEVKCCRKSTKPKAVVVASGNQGAPQLEVDPLTPRVITEPLSSSTRDLETASVELTKSVLPKPSTRTLEYSRTNQDEEDRPCYFCFRRRRKSKPTLRDVTQITRSLEPTETLRLTSGTPITQPAQVIECKSPCRHDSKERTLKSDLWRQVPKSRSEPSQLSQATWKATGHPTEAAYSDKAQSRIVLVESDVTSKEMDLSKELGVQTLISEVINPVKVVRHDPSEDRTATHYTILSQSRSISLENAPKSIVEHPEWTPHKSVSVEQHAQSSRSSTYCEDEKRPLYVWIGPREKRSSEAAQVAIEYRAPSPPGVIERFDLVDSNISRPCSAAETTHRLDEISCQVEPNQDYSTLARTDPSYDSSNDEFYQTVPIEVPTNPSVGTHLDSTHVSWDPVQMPRCDCHCHCQFPVVCVPFPYVAAAKMNSAWHYPTTTAFSCACCCNCYMWCMQLPPTNHNLPFFTSEPVQR
ncbi:hypothetical protein PHET_02022 [Paragonimus heterotremus]|uniref:Uncharacterized protein n=1 Tax=Paragonimus heterotremus TaxID=100268 RepID=A0A8J4TQE5_9TREM|nr:hypothetical protein PHET_02022 [Paragonimus heterotremus]